MAKKQYTNYDDTLFGRYVRQLENPDSIGWDPATRTWFASTRKGDDPNNRGMGVDIKYNAVAKAKVEGRPKKELSEAEERQLRNEHIGYVLGAIDRHKKSIPTLRNMSPRTEAEVVGALYRGDADSLWNPNTTIGKALRSGNEDNFHKAVTDFYMNSVNLPERAKNNNLFWEQQDKASFIPTTVQLGMQPIVEQPDAIQPSTYYKGIMENTKEAPTGPYKEGYGSPDSQTRKDSLKKSFDSKVAFDNMMKTISIRNNPTSEFKFQFKEGGYLQPKDAWDRLSLPEQAAMMEVAVRNGIYNLQDIRKKYNEFAEGGEKEDEKYYSIMEKVAEENYKDWGMSNPDEALLHALNDNTYNYRDFYRKNPQSEANASTHWTDEFKTVYHPTFSNESIYSGKVSQYNPYGLLGGYWIDGKFIQAAWQKDNLFGTGGGIHIKKSHRGRLTELKKRTGKTEAELYRTGSPATRKMITFARSARKWHKQELGGPLVKAAMNEYMHGGPMGNYYDGWGDFTNFLRKGYNKAKGYVQKGREVVHQLGLDRSPTQHLTEWIEKIESNRPKGNNNLDFTIEAALMAAKTIGLDKRYKGKKDDVRYRQNIYNRVDPTSAAPHTVGEALDYLKIAEKAKSDKDLSYWRKYEDATANAGWAKRLGLPYDSTLLISNPDGSVHLSKQLEDEMPVDTVFLKNRIANNERLLKNTYGKKRQIVDLGLDFDRKALNALRYTYSTGLPVEMHEASYVNRAWLDNNSFDSGLTPLSILHRYNMQYDKDNNKMNYFDTYNFDEFEDFVPGEPFEIKGSIDLNKKK